MNALAMALSIFIDTVFTTSVKSSVFSCMFMSVHTYACLIVFVFIAFYFSL